MKTSTSGVLDLAIFLFELLLVIATSAGTSFSNGISYHVGCIGSERAALLRFKQDLKDPSNRLASWIGDGDCCAWTGVLCDNMTGHVLHLDLRNPLGNESEHEANLMSTLVGNINPSLLDLKYLRYLDLSFNDFQGVQIPSFLGSMENLRYLNLSRTQIRGMIPHQLGNLSNLQFLDLSLNYLLNVENIWWLSGLSYLEHLDLASVDLSKASDWLLVTNKLPSLVELRLSNCQLHHLSPLANSNFSSLRVLDLSGNQFFDTLIPSWVSGLSHLLFLDLSFNNLRGPIPEGLQNLTSLRHLGLDSNHFNSSIPSWLYRFTHLEHLALRRNHLQGTIDSEAIGNLSSIRCLDLSLNIGLVGRIPRSMGNLCKLVTINLRGVHLSQEISEILDIFSGCVSNRLESLDLRSSSISGHLTDKLRKFRNLVTLDLANNSIVGLIPESLGTLSTLRVLQIYNNKLNGSLSEVYFANLTKLSWFRIGGNRLTLEMRDDWVPPFQLVALGLHNCYVGSGFPIWLYSQKLLQFLNLDSSRISDVFPIQILKSAPRLKFLELRQNQIHGQIPNLTEFTQLLYLNVDSNNLSGPIPLVSSNLVYQGLSNNLFSGLISHFLCYRINETKSLQALKLNDNNLQGEIPDCWLNYQSLRILKLSNNRFSGDLPNSLGSLTSLVWLHLGNNRLSGTIPVSVQNCTALESLDVGGNDFVGNIPTWFGERFTSMVVLILRSNKFRGHFPAALCNLAFLQVLDLANNSLSGTIPKCISNLIGMVRANSFTRGVWQDLCLPLDMDVILTEKALVLGQGEVVEYFNLVTIGDISWNNLAKKIPLVVENLRAGYSLNFSYNSFMGRIPEDIGALRSLESIDFSVNQLSGGIPQSMSSLTLLNHLNLSDNKLTGKIPSSAQLQSFDASSFGGNELCGAPLPKNCTLNVSISEDENEDEVDHGLYISMGIGFVVGFCCFVGPLLANRRWRKQYCHFQDRLWDRFVRFARKYC